MLLWATTLQGESMAVAWWLSRRDDVALLVVARHADRLATEPIVVLGGLRIELVDRDDPSCGARVRRFAADIAVFDNHVPPPGSAPRLCSIWHGLGWKARPEADLRAYRRAIMRVLGRDPRQDTGDFVAPCYGRPDHAWRVERWGLPPRACPIIGMPMSDLLRDPPYARGALGPWYPELDVDARKTVVVSLTWHYGGLLPGRRLGTVDDARDVGFLGDVLDTARDAGAQVLLCMHDRHRFRPELLREILRLAAARDRVHLKFKDERPDNLADLLLADVMLTNLSSFVAYHYLSGRPSVHLLPADGASVGFAHVDRGRLRVAEGNARWMIAASDTGGLDAYDAAGALDCLRLALADEHVCEARARDWLARRDVATDGAACARLVEVLRHTCGMAT